MKRLLIALLLAAGCREPIEGDRTIVRAPDPVVATSSASVEYRISFAEKGANYLAVEGVFPVDPNRPLVLSMPVWTPGSYMVREYSRNVHDFSARSSKGPLAHRKVRKNRWRVETDGSSHIAIEYRLYARHPSVRESFVDRDLLVLNGAAAFFADAEHERRYRVKLELPEEWKAAATSLRPDPNEPHAYWAERFDELVDSPIVAGDLAIHRFEIAGVEHFLVNSEEGTVWDGARSAKDTETIAKAVIDFWGVLPYDRYYFLNVINDQRGGLEHENSTLIMTPRFRMRNDDDYRGWLSTVAHEHFHAWNGKRLRPRVLGPFDYEREVYTTDLWMVEGITNYYDDLLLARAGLMSADQFLASLSRVIAEVETGPGRKHDSLADASFDAWIEFYRWDENTSNMSINYYAKGAVIGFLIDAAIRRETNDSKSLDDVMRIAYQRHSGARGYESDELYGIVEEVAGKGVADQLRRMVETTEDLVYEPAFDWYGLEFDPPAEREAKAYLGVKSTDRSGRIVVTEVIEGGPAHGRLNPADEIIAIDNYRIDDLSDRIERYRPKDRVKVTIARRGVLTDVEVVLAEKPKESWKVRPEKVRSATQIQRFDKLLRVR